MEYKARPYQEHCLEHIRKNPYAGLFIDLGLGKTAICLTYIKGLQPEQNERVLVIAPKMVAENTWDAEIAKWDHLKGMKLAKVLGTVKERKMALKEKADVYIINRENVPWLVGLYGTAWPFKTVIVDELTSFKNSKAIRFRALKMVRPYMKRFIGLTGTPRPNGVMDLWAQLYLIDRGERLGKTITGYREQYFDKGFMSYDYKLKKGDELLGANVYEKEIYDKISDICISMKTEDYLDLPELIENDVFVSLDPETLKKYNDFERDQILKLPAGDEISPVNAAGLTNKLLQFANGAVYDDDKVWHAVHDLKLCALEELVEAASGSPMLVFYSYQSDLERIREKLKGYDVVKFERPEHLRDWNAGKIQVMLAHPASAGHGLNLQEGGHLVTWFGLTWNSEYYSQGIKRVHRSGQRHDVTMSRLIVKGTMDEDVISSIGRKLTGQNAMMDAIKARIEKWR